MLTTTGLAVAGVAAMSVPIIIHLLTRYRRRPELWGAMRFLMEAYRKHRTRLQVEQLLLLAVRCLILGVLGLALAGPMLSGCAGSALGTLAGTGRIVHLVIDDSLTTHTIQTDDEQRFARLQEAALSIVDALNASDRVAVWRAAQPVESVVAPSLDHSAAREAITQMKPRYSRADLPSALLEVNRALNDPAARAAGAGQVFVMVLSDFSQSTLPLDRPAPAELAALGDRCKLFLAQPMDERGNVQIQALQPRRHMVVADRDGASVPVELRLRRFADEAADRVTEVEFAILSPEGEPIDRVRRQHRWSNGQAEAVLAVEVPLTDALSRLSGRELEAAVSHALAVHARIVEDDRLDALAADNQAWSIVDVRRRISVGLIDAPVGIGVDTIEPRQWLTLALQPLEGLGDVGPGRVELVSMSPVAIEPERLAAMDAVMVLRPDMLSDAGWDALASFTRQGGLVWVFVPATTESTSGVWGPKLVDRFGLNWRIGIEAVNADRADERVFGIAEAAATAVSDRYWTLLTEGELSTVPEPLRLLAADWSALSKPIRVTRRVPLEVLGGDGAAQSMWLRLNDEQRSVLLASATVEDGRVLMLAVALDPAWSNLPTKPLFVPLLHESLRGVLGESPQLRRLSAGRAGDRPLLGRTWEGAQRLQQVAGLKDGQAESQLSVMLQRGEAGLSPVSPLPEPGVWSADPPAAGQLLATNVDTDAGDTRRLDPARIEAWFSPVGTVQWLDAASPAASLAAEPTRLSLSWPLLAMVMVLVLLETLLARWFSHATAKPAGPATIGQMAAMVRRATS